MDQGMCVDLILNRKNGDEHKMKMKQLTALCFTLL